MNNLIVRAIAGLIFSALVICSAWLGPVALGILFLCFAMAGLYEYYRMGMAGRHSNAHIWTGLIAGLFLYLLLTLYFNDTIELKWLWLFPIIVVLILSAELIKPDNRAAINLGIVAFGWLYVVIPFALVNLLAFSSGVFDYELPIGYFLILWVNDSGAYLFGRMLGRTKLYPKVSPNKTWEGLIGGILCAFLIGYLLSLIFMSLHWQQWIFISLIISLFANAGDLFESHLKRTAGVKDSGNVIPGHGGVLDRFDGLFFSLPVVVAYIHLV
ncbi:MAG: phosphatidate cytidylyltransferase [Flavobacteriales bacterium]